MMFVMVVAIPLTLIFTIGSFLRPSYVCRGFNFPPVFQFKAIFMLYLKKFT